VRKAKIPHWCNKLDSSEPSDTKKVKVSAQTATCEIGEEAEPQVCKTSKRKKAAIPESAPSTSTRKYCFILRNNRPVVITNKIHS